MQKQDLDGRGQPVAGTVNVVEDMRLSPLGEEKLATDGDFLAFVKLGQIAGMGFNGEMAAARGDVFRGHPAACGQDISRVRSHFDICASFM